MGQIISLSNDGFSGWSAKTNGDRSHYKNNSDIEKKKKRDLFYSSFPTRRLPAPGAHGPQAAHSRLETTTP